MTHLLIIGGSDAGYLLAALRARELDFTFDVAQAWVKAQWQPRDTNRTGVSAKGY